MKEFKKYYIIPAHPEEVYLALTTEITVQLWTGAEAQVNAVEGGEFSLWEDAIIGEFVSLEPAKKIVQKWFFGDVESVVTLKLHEHKKGTSLEVNQNNIPDEAYADIIAGWSDPYMSSLIDFYMED